MSVIAGCESAARSIDTTSAAVAAMAAASSCLAAAVRSRISVSGSMLPRSMTPSSEKKPALGGAQRGHRRPRRRTRRRQSPAAGGSLRRQRLRAQPAVAEQQQRRRNRHRYRSDPAGDLEQQREPAPGRQDRRHHAPEHASGGEYQTPPQRTAPPAQQPCPRIGGGADLLRHQRRKDRWRCRNRAAAARAMARRVRHCDRTPPPFGSARLLLADGLLGRGGLGAAAGVAGVAAGVPADPPAGKASPRIDARICSNREWPAICTPACWTSIMRPCTEFCASSASPIALA